MCGLVGVASVETLSVDAQKALWMMLKLDEIRGEDSVGLLRIHSTTYDTTVLRSLGRRSEFLEEHKNHALVNSNIGGLSAHLSKVLMGHNRAATRGEVNVENAHPFDIGRLVGAHNGTLRMPSLTEFKGYEGDPVDSRILYTELDEQQGDISKVYSRVDGAMTLTWWDREKNSMNFIRNSQRPLFFACSGDNKTLFWASEPWMIYAAFARHPFAFRTKEEAEAGYKFPKIENMPINIHHELPIEDQEEINFITEEHKEYTPVYPSTGSYGSYGGHYNQNYAGKQRQNVGGNANDAVSPGSNVTHLEKKNNRLRASKRGDFLKVKLFPHLPDPRDLKTLYPDNQVIRAVVTMGYFANRIFYPNLKTNCWDDEPVILLPNAEDTVNFDGKEVAYSWALQQCVKLGCAFCQRNDLDPKEDNWEKVTFVAGAIVCDECTELHEELAYH